MMNETIVKVDKVQKTFGKKEVLKEINLQVHSGEVIALLGENGAGKSTLINIINNLITATTGDVTLFGGQHNRKASKEKTGVMLQKDIILRRVKVQEVLELARSHYDNPLPLKQIIEIGDLEELLDLEMTKLSGGQQRRLSFAIAMAGNPDLLFLDEPTASMDTRSRRRVWQNVGDLKNQGKTVFVTSHYLEELEDIATRIIILQDGLIAFDGSLAQLRGIQGEGMVEFTSQLPRETFDEFPDLIRVNHQGDHFTLITREVKQTVKELLPYFNDIENLTVQQTTLETLFAYFRKE